MIFITIIFLSIFQHLQNICNGCFALTFKITTTLIYIHSEYHIGTSKIKDISDTFKSKIGVLALTTNLVVRNVREV